MEDRQAGVRSLAEWTHLRPEHLFDLSGRTALVTGAAGGLGQWLAAGLAAAGAHTVLTDRDAERLKITADALSPHADTSTDVADLHDQQDCQELIDRTVERCGRLDVLINCAAVNSRSPTLDVDQSTYDRIMDNDLKVPFFLAQASARHMIDQGGGSIVHVGSINSSFGLARVAVYGAAKAALSQLTRVQAVEWGRHRIRVNCLAPGFLKTPLSEPLWADPAIADWILTRVPLARPGLPHEMTGLLLLLASDAGAFLTGHTFYADGGFLAGGNWSIHD
ncbi:SDR family oxidoreductase [Solwaraspora sp. WMMD791]|uniref:SDR family NAD(P)-dependent oxidoreductase n=1 Tax=Solwaraspora sp. WMMD791 TaxID=3016086 RepID=UPI00249B7F7D|nr:SDR family oxidoreductase [Solwaraspora sp. WMMD791]WFE26850.1 SDR family oxidoreductase [Solwaraspora sp. WMMD791]